MDFTRTEILDMLGHLGYIFIALGVLVIGHYKHRLGWVCRFLGGGIWLAVGLAMNMSSIYLWSAVFMCIDFYSFWVWDEILEDEQ